MKNKKIICFGELVVDCFGSIYEGFVPKFGGAPGNTAVGLAKLGQRPVEFVGKVGDDFFGDFLAGTLLSFGIKIQHLVRSKKDKTTLAFVALGPRGERDFSFFSGAHKTISPREVAKVNFESTSIFQFGSLTQATPESYAATEKLLAKAKAKKVFRSYDPNVRLPLWDKPKELKKIIFSTIPHVDMLKVNEEELEFLTGTRNPQTGAAKLWKPNLQLLLVTLGPKGAFWKTKNASGMAAAPKVKPLDTTGAGDAFNAGLLFQLQSSIQDGKLLLSPDEIQKKMEFATKVAGISTLKKGAIDGLPTLGQVKAFVQS